jgi:hypothetical protein
VTALQTELTRAQEDASREKERRADGLEAALRESRAARADADVLRGQLEEARAAGSAAGTRADALGQQLAAAEARLRVLEQQAEAREAHVSRRARGVCACVAALAWFASQNVCPNKGPEATCARSPACSAA